MSDQLSRVIHIRFGEKEAKEVAALAQTLGVPVSTILRRAVEYGLPSLKQSLRLAAGDGPAAMPPGPEPLAPAPAASSMPSAPCPVIVAGEDPDLNLR